MATSSMEKKSNSFFRTRQYCYASSLGEAGVSARGRPGAVREAAVREAAVSEAAAPSARGRTEAGEEHQSLLLSHHPCCCHLSKWYLQA